MSSKRHRDAIKALAQIGAACRTAQRKAELAGELTLAKELLELRKQVQEKIGGHRSRIEQLRK